MQNDIYDQALWRSRSTKTFQAIEHGLYAALGFLLCATCLMALGGAALMLWVGLGDWTNTETVFVVIDRLLVVLMLIEILHTVMVSMRSGSLTCEPFLIVGLIASIRRVLVITLESSQANGQGKSPEATEMIFRTSMIELGLLGILILVMVASIYLLRRANPPSNGL
jgi:uncharacterized membrane protein (DUF373 family)